MYTILIEVLVALSIAAAGALATWEHMHKKVAAAEEAQHTAEKALEVTQATLAVRDTARAATAVSVASARASLQHSLAAPAATQWADMNVPREVQNALCATVACPASAPAGVSSGAGSTAP